MNDDLDTRVGYMTIDVLLKTTKQYINAMTDKDTGKYIGDIQYLTAYQQSYEHMHR